MPPRRAPRVLAVDDDPAICELYRAHLEPLGCVVDTAPNGLIALDKIGAARYDLVLLDLVMPVLAGFDTLERIRRDHPVEKLPVVLVTGAGDAESRRRGHDLRATEYLTKPLDRHEFLARMKTLLAMRAAQAELEDRVAELERLNDLKDLMVSTVSTDLRSPLATAKGFLELGLDALRGGNPVAVSNLEEARALVIAGADMAMDLSDIPRMAEGKLPLLTEPVDAEKLAEARLLAYEHVATSRNLHLVVRNSEDSARVMADKRLLDRIVGNLFNHAIASCPNGSAVEMVIEPFAGSDHTMLSIHFDSNESVSAGLEKRVFDKAAQAEMHRKGYIRNAGMELTFCRHATALLGGTMSVEANLVGRVTFAFTLPRLAARKA